MGGSGSDVELAAVGLEVEIVGDAADVEIGEEFVFFEVDDGNLTGSAGRDECFRAVGEYGDLLGARGDRNNGESGEGGGVEEEDGGFIAIGDDKDFGVGSEARDPSSRIGS